MLKITGVSKYKGSTNMIEFEEGETAFLNYEIVSAYGLRAGLDMPESAWEKIVFDNEFRKAKERALYLLDYRDYSYVELYKKLEKNYSEEICDAVMDKMLELGTVNDRRYAQGLARTYVEVRKYGYYRAYQQMRQKGLTKPIIEEALEEYSEGTYERLYELVERKYLRYLDGEKGDIKVKNALVRLGYSYDIIKEVLADIKQEYGDE